MSYAFNSTKAQRRMIRRWCLDKGLMVSGHDAVPISKLRETHNGMRFGVVKNHNAVKYPGIANCAILEWTGQSLEVLSDACAYLQMTLPSDTAVMVVVRSPPPTPPSRAKK